MGIAKMKNGKLHIIQRLILALAFLAMAALVLFWQLFAMPRDAGNLIVFLRGIAGTGILFEVASKSIMIAAFMLFLGFLILTADLWLDKQNGSWFEKRLLTLFFAMFLVAFLDDVRYGIPYQLIHGLLSGKGLVLTISVSVAVLVASKCYRTIGGVKGVGIGVLILVVPVLLLWPLTGLRWAMAQLLASYGYYAAVFASSFLVLHYHGMNQAIAFLGCIAIVLLCGQSLINPDGMRLSADRTQQLVETMEIYDLIYEREGTKDVLVMGNNEGLLRILMMDDDAQVPYHPETFYTGRRGRLYAEEMMQYLYQSAENKEEGLGLLTTYAQQNGYRYVLLVQQDGLEYNMVVDGGYEILYEGQDMQLYYK